MLCPIHVFRGGGKLMAPVGGAAKGFWDAKQDRYLIWHVSAIRAGFSLAREVAVDTELEILLEAPAREYVIRFAILSFIPEPPYVRGSLSHSARTAMYHPFLAMLPSTPC